MRSVTFGARLTSLQNRENEANLLLSFGVHTFSASGSRGGGGLLYPRPPLQTRTLSLPVCVHPRFSDLATPPDFERKYKANIATRDSLKERGWKGEPALPIKNCSSARVSIPHFLPGEASGNVKGKRYRRGAERNGGVQCLLYHHHQYKFIGRPLL